MALLAACKPTCRPPLADPRPARPPPPAPPAAATVRGPAADQAPPEGVRVSPARLVTAEEAFVLTTTNMGELAAGSCGPASGYSGRWWRWEGATTTRKLDSGRDVYAFRWKPGTPPPASKEAAGAATAQVWLALTSKQQASPFVGPRLHSDPIQAELEMETNIMELSSATPMFQPSIAEQLPNLAASMRTWAVEGYGFCTAPAGLPAFTGRAEDGGAPTSGPWVATPLLRLPGPGGERWSVKLKYCPRTGALLDTRHSWEASLGPLAGIKDAFGPPGGPPAAARESPPCIDAWFASASPRLALRRSAEFAYSGDGGWLLRADASSGGGGGAAGAAAGGGGGGDGWWWARPTQMSGEARVAEVRYPGSGAYARAPLSLAPLAAAGEDAVLEAGALMPDGSLARWVLRYATAGDGRLKSATHQLFGPPRA